MRHYLPTLIFFLASTALLFISPLLGLAAMGLTAAYVVRNVVKGVSRLVSRLLGRPTGVRGNRRSAGRQVAANLTRGKYWSRRNGWDMDRIPLDMKPRVSGDSLTLSKDGVPVMVSAQVRRDGTADFTFPVYDAKAAQRVHDRISKGVFGASVRRENGMFFVTATEASVAGDLLSVAYPVKNVSVEKETHSVNQYVISGCSSFDEARKRFMQMKSDGTLGQPDHCCVYDVYRMGEETETYGSKPYSPESIEVGKWLINDEKVEAVKASVAACGTDNQSLFSSAVSLFDGCETSPVPTKSVLSQVSDGGDSVKFRTVTDSQGAEIPLVKAESLAGGAMAVCRCANLQEFVDLVNNGSVPEGKFLEVGSNIAAGEMDVCIPLNSQNISRLALQGEASPSQARFNEAVGVRQEDLVASEAAAAAKNGTSLTMVAGGELGLDDARVGGVPLMELTDRLACDRLPKFDAESAARWLRDASMIQAVSMTVDVKNKELRITSQVNDVVKVETRKLTDEDISSLEKKGKVSKAEMKDVLMQMHPDFFESYSSKHGMTVADPLKDFMANRQPLSAQQAVQNMLQKKAVTAKVKPAGTKIVKHI